MSNTTKLDEMYYGIAEEVINATKSIAEENPTDGAAQVDQLMHLTQNVMAVFVEALSGIDEERTVLLAKNAFKIAQLRKQAQEKKGPSN